MDRVKITDLPKRIYQTGDKLPLNGFGVLLDSLPELPAWTAQTKLIVESEEGTHYRTTVYELVGYLDSIRNKQNDIKEALLIIGPIATALGLDLSEITAFFDTLERLRAAGISGSAAGVQLRRVLKDIYDEKENEQ